MLNRDSVVTLIAQIDAETEEHFDLFATIESVGQKEFFAAAQTGIKSEYRVIVWQSDYAGQTVIELPVGIGIKKRWQIYRTYARNDGKIELYLAEKIGVFNG
jgi:hypothetical protein